MFLYNKLKQYIWSCGYQTSAALIQQEYGKTYYEESFYSRFTVLIIKRSLFSPSALNLLSVGNNIVEIGANWIHGPSEENPVFCLARQYGLLDPEALTPENQAMDVGGHSPWVPRFFSSSGSQIFIQNSYLLFGWFKINNVLITPTPNLVGTSGQSICTKGRDNS